MRAGDRTARSGPAPLCGPNPRPSGAREKKARGSVDSEPPRTSSGWSPSCSGLTRPPETGNEVTTVLFLISRIIAKKTAEGGQGDARPGEGMDGRRGAASARPVTVDIA